MRRLDRSRPVSAAARVLVPSVSHWVLIALAWSACSPPASRERPRPRHSLWVEVSGCAELRDPSGSAASPGPTGSPTQRTCLLPAAGTGRPHKLRLWVRSDPGDARLDIDPAPDGPGTPIQGGRLFRLSLPEGAGRIELTSSAGADQRVWRLALAAAPEPSSDEIRAREFFRSGKELQAFTLLEQTAQAGNEDLRAILEGLLGRLVLVAGDPARAADLLASAMERDQRLGRRTSAEQNGLALAFVSSVHLRRNDEARRLLDHLRADPGTTSEGRLQAALIGGIVALEDLDLRSALDDLDEAARRARRIGRDDLLAQVFKQRGEVLIAMGRADEAGDALAAAAGLMPPDSDPCARGDLLNDQGWAAVVRHDMDSLLGTERPARPDPRTVELLEAALVQYSDCGPARLANVHVNLALALLQEGRPDLAGAHLATVRRLDDPPTPRLVLWWRDVEARIALARNEPRAALAHYESLARLADDLVSPDARWRAAIGRARSLQALGRPDEALRAYQRAERLLDDQGLLIPIDAGRGGFFAQRELSTQHHLRLLLEVGRISQAAELARLSRRRLLAGLLSPTGLDIRSDSTRAAFEQAIGRYRAARQALERTAAQSWREPRRALLARRRERQELRRAAQAALDEAFGLMPGAGDPGPLQTAADGELWLLYQALPDGWVGFAIQPGGVKVRRLGLLRPGAGTAESARTLIEPFHESIAGAKRIRVLASGVLSRIDFHALPFGSGLLIDHAPVTYSADLGRTSARPAGPIDSSAPRLVVIVADPDGNLPRAAAEAVDLLEFYRAEPGWRVRLLRSVRANRERLLEVLPRSYLLHFAGHGAQGGLEGWTSHLSLARGGSLSVGDVLALSSPPELVVLSGCQTAQGDGTIQISLGHAFLAAGSRGVVAATRRVDDEVARAMSTALHRALLEDAELDLGAALQAAQRGVRVRLPGADWAAFRALER